MKILRNNALVLLQCETSQKYISCSENGTLECTEERTLESKQAYGGLLIMTFIRPVYSSLLW